MAGIEYIAKRVKGKDYIRQQCGAGISGEVSRNQNRQRSSTVYQLPKEPDQYGRRTCDTEQGCGTGGGFGCIPA